MFLNLEKYTNTNQIALQDSYGVKITYKELIAFSNFEIQNCINERELVFIISNNEVGSAALYYACVQNSIVPLIIGADTNSNKISELVSIYSPAYIIVPERTEKNLSLSGNKINVFFQQLIIKTGFKSPELDPNLSLLLSTSGSTGSPKLVRHSYSNLEANAKNVSKVFNIEESHKPILFLPLQYTMGLSILTSHLYAGATIYLTDLALTDKNFWNYVSENQITNFTGVPFSFEILDKLRFFRNNTYSSIRIISQGGGKLDISLFEKIAEFAHANNIQFIPTYGQTEATARMCYLPHTKTLSKKCSIGNAIPEGEIFIEYQNEPNTDNQIGELIYKGPNVTLGYAENLDDLLKGDEFKGQIKTGDLVEVDGEGDIFIVGRKKRFLKLFGLRISLDIVENSIKNTFDTDVYCVGDDKLLKILITNKELIEDIKKHTIELTNLYHKAIKVVHVDAIPRSKSGKVLYTDAS